jgi:DNA polymerase-3 subunit epsilon
MAWIDGPLIGLDLETDSPDPEDAHLITAAVLHHVPGRLVGPVVRYEWVAQPTRPIPDAAAKIHGYTTERAMAEGRPIAQVLDEIDTALNAAWSQDCPLIACNSPFDLTVLDREFSRNGDTAYDPDALPPVIDSFLIDRRCDKWRPGSRTLSATCEHYGVVLGSAHVAGDDCAATMRLVWHQARRHLREDNPWPMGRYGPSADEIEARRILASGDVMALYAAQRRWFREQSMGLAAYFRTPKAIAKIERDHEAGVTTRAEADELIRTLPARADDVERNADGWPMRRR